MKKLTNRTASTLLSLKIIFATVRLLTDIPQLCIKGHPKPMKKLQESITTRYAATCVDSSNFNAALKAAFEHAAHVVG
jgi:hypothetical protein